MAADATAEPRSTGLLPATPPLWAWCLAAALGSAARAFLVLSTEGSLDVTVWAGHAREILDHGLVADYRGGGFQLNHPPPAAWGVTVLWRLAEATGLPFAVLLRAPTALLDVATAGLLWRLLAPHPARGWWVIAFWLHPLAWILSAYHGNTDTALLPFLLGAAIAAGRGRAALAGALLGASLWIKLPGALAAPAILLALPDLRRRLHFAAAAAGVGILGFLPALLIDAEAVIRAVFLYTPLRIQTTGGEPVWGLLAFLPPIGEIGLDWRPLYRDAIRAALRMNNLVLLAAIGWLAFCQRGEERTPIGVGRRIAGAYTIVYGLTNFWAFQYFAWALPFWSTLGWRFALGASLAATSYVYGYYALLCDDPWLRGSWDFRGHPVLPWWLLVLRNAATLFFFVAALRELLRGTREAWRRTFEPG